MSERILETWLRERTPDVPPPLLPMLLEEGDGAVSSEAFVALGQTYLERALAAPGRNREAAYHLLVGDAFLTYALEALAASEDVAEGLESFLEGLGGRFQP